MDKKQKEKQEEDQKPIPFNEALKRVWASPPQPKITKKKKAKKVK